MTTKDLEKTINSLKHEVERLQAVHEIQNMMGRYEYWHTAAMNEEIGKMFAKKAPGIRTEYINSGVYEGAEGAWKFIVDIHNILMKGRSRAGQLSVHTLTTPVIEVAGDGKTARGLWISPGYEILPVEGVKKAVWLLEEYAADFIKEDGEWKFWRIHLYRVFVCPYDKSWVETDPKTIGISPALHPEFQPDRPTTYNKMYSLNDTCGITEHIPPAPEPYETWDDSMACIKE